MSLRNLAVLTLLALIPVTADAETVRIEADRDATLVEHPDGDLANGSGPAFFVGRTGQGQNSIRRTLLRFDVASALPERAIIESVSLTLFMRESNPETREIRLYRVLTDWGEGPSSASGGGGRPSEPGDVTWIHTFYDFEFWTHSGGQFVGRASARLDVAGSAFYTLESTNHLVQDVRLWVSAPQRNFGWILIGDETTSQTAKSFASRENSDPVLRPMLVVTYRTPGRSGRVSLSDPD
jgi:hypothetical protein